jgi:hypothetical protein
VPPSNPRTNRFVNMEAHFPGSGGKRLHPRSLKLKKDSRIW